LKNVNSFSTITGKEANATYKIQTRFNVLYKEYITSILTSPSVEMYVHQTPFNQIDVNKFMQLNYQMVLLHSITKILISN
jgi:hypothetical protein